jgi:hypothetical protein
MASKWLQTLPRKTNYSPVGHRFWAQSASDSQGRTGNRQPKGAKHPKISPEIDGKTSKIMSKYEKIAGPQSLRSAEYPSKACCLKIVRALNHLIDAMDWA